MLSPSISRLFPFAVPLDRLQILSFSFLKLQQKLLHLKKHHGAPAPHTCCLLALRFQFWHWHPINLCITPSLFFTLPSPSAAAGSSPGCDFRGKFWQPWWGTFPSPSPGPDHTTCVCKTPSSTGLDCLVCFLEGNSFYCTWYLLPERAGYLRLLSSM